MRKMLIRLLFLPKLCKFRKATTKGIGGLCFKGIAATYSVDLGFQRELDKQARGYNSKSLLS